ncbi:hypothetical protein STRDD11_01488 [Streptococcus sp. DD11]|uniref:hypothetical protein n=1 Tax=Streptococcus sp. DD11 TaxID=1777879 RepID=UPI00079C0BA1|nr:hypothetical protein [Streptococcus sp. DD11]KXT83461.1 hypothetical protein STRDD11_01488 [Streptococcus sp. DD11]
MAAGCSEAETDSRDDCALTHRGMELSQGSVKKSSRNFEAADKASLALSTTFISPSDLTKVGGGTDSLSPISNSPEGLLEQGGADVV